MVCHIRSYKTFFGVSRESACKFFNNVTRLIVAECYNAFVKLPETDEEWEAELRGFIENYGFPCVGAWDSQLFYCRRLQAC